MQWDVLSFGETMIRLSVPLGERLETAASLEVRIGGAESNVAVALARLGRRAAWCSILPRNPLGRRIAGELRWHGVDLSPVQWVDRGRVGVYFLDTGASPRATQVLYDRTGSAIASAPPDAVDPSIVTGARLLHLTGITPALSPSCREIARRLVEHAQQAGVPICFDVNYRSLLWTPKEAAEALAPFCRAATVLICGRGDAATVWGLNGDAEDVLAGLAHQFSAPVTVLTLGDGGALARAADGRCLQAPSVPATVVDRVGAGDAFAAGFLHGYLDERDLARGLQYGVALAALKLTLQGDLALVTSAELEAVIAGTPRAIVR